MKKTAHALTISMIVFLLTAYPVSALSILIGSNGSISISQGQVLGDDSESDESENEKEDENEDENENEDESDKNDDSAAEKQAEEQKKTAENKRESEKRTTERKLEQNKELRNVRASENKRLKVRQDSRGTEVMLESRDDVGRAAEDMMKLERIEARDLNVELPADQRFENEVENEIREAGEDRQDRQMDSARLIEVKREREQRTDKVEIKSKIEDDGRTEFELEAGSVKAKLRSAEFTVDPETHEVRIVTSSGQEQLLVHLPDQALERMTELASLHEGDRVAESELRVETNAEGRVVYKAKMTEMRKVLGFIPVQFHSEVELEDDTSELRLTSTDDSAMTRLLRAMSL